MRLERHAIFKGIGAVGGLNLAARGKTPQRAALPTGIQLSELNAGLGSTRCQQ